jgi:hypothetical protein
VGGMNYTLSLFDLAGRMLTTEPFDASNDITALEAAGTVLRACQDVAVAYEVRREGILVARDYRQRRLLNRQSAIDLQQGNVLDLLHRLQTGFTDVALSRRLLRVTAKVRRQGFL